MDLTTSHWGSSQTDFSTSQWNRYFQNGAKHKVTFDVADVTLCKHSETLAPFSCLAVSKWSEIVRTYRRYALESTGDRRLAKSGCMSCISSDVESVDINIWAAFHSKATRKWRPNFLLNSMSLLNYQTLRVISFAECRTPCSWIFIRVKVDLRRPSTQCCQILHSKIYGAL